MKNRLFYFVLSLGNLTCNGQATEVFSLVFEGETAKEIGAGRTVELHNAVIMQAGHKAYADLDGKAALVIPSDPELVFRKADQLWIEIWLNPTIRGKIVSLVSKGSGANYRLGLDGKGNAFFGFYAEGQWRTVAATEPLALDTWQQLACYFDSASGQALLFLDGKVIASSTEQLPFQSSTTDPLYIGGVPGKEAGDFSGFKGLLGSVKIDRETPHHFSSKIKIGDQVFEVKPAF